MPPPLPVALLPVIVTLVSVAVHVEAKGQLAAGFNKRPPPSWLAWAVLLLPSVPAILPLITVPWSIDMEALVSIPPPNPAALFPEIVLEWMKLSPVAALTF